jgi:hypothetical protein
VEVMGRGRGFITSGAVMSHVDGLVQLSFCVAAGTAIISGGDAGFTHGRDTAITHTWYQSSAMQPMTDTEWRVTMR